MSAKDSQYTMGYSDTFMTLLQRRNARSCAGHLLDRLRPGMRVLDFGCGPGSISVGLAEAVAPDGKLTGVDMEASQIEMATRESARSGVPAEFRVADVTDLPFEAETFDAAHCHAVLMHVPDTAAAVAEVLRVLKPGGILAARESIIASSFFEPHFGTLQHAWQIFGALTRGNGGHPDIGKRLARIVIQAGFEVQEADAAFEMFATPEDRAFWYGFVNAWYFSDEVKAAANKHGIASAEQFDRWERDVKRWRESAGGISGLAWGHVVATKPGAPCI